MVMQMAATKSPSARNALIELTQRYWYPVYAYVRRCGHKPPIALDITRTFLTGLMLEFRNGSAVIEQGHFRRFLLAQLNAFLAADWHEATEDGSLSELSAPPADLEARYQRDHIGPHSPEQAYQRSFALEVLARAFKRLRSEARKTGHLEMYEELERYLGVDPAAGVYEELSIKLQSRPLALVVALKRLRQRFRELVAEELTDTVTSAEDLGAEQQALHKVLSEMRS